MFPLLLFLGSAVLLTIEGAFLLRMLPPSTITNAERWLLGFPVGAFLNALLFFFLTVLRVPLSFWMVYGAHCVGIAVLLFFYSRRRIVQQFPISNFQSIFHFPFSIFHFPFKSFLVVLLLFSLSIKVFYAFSHAVLLPSYYFDTVSQWNMRAKISYEDQRIAFDRVEERGMSKPQYPILLHSLQILFMLPQGEWFDRTANASTFLLTISSFGALFFLLRRCGSLFALLTATLLSIIPLLVIQTGQGYGDIHVVEYLLLSAVFLTFSIERVPKAWVSWAPRLQATSRGKVGPWEENQWFFSHDLLLSALFAAAAAWVKQEGLFFGVLPWLFLVAIVALSRKILWRQLSLAVSPVILGFLWTFYISVQGFPIGAHVADFKLEWHSEGVLQVIKVLFSFGSFGVYFYVLPVALFVVAYATFRKARNTVPSLLIILWGMLAFIETLFVFLSTPNYQYLTQHLTFHRTMLLPLSLLVLGCVLFLGERWKSRDVLAQKSTLEQS